MAVASGHGTHVAGIIAAEPKNGLMLGVAPAAKILPLNIMSAKGGGTLSAAVFAVKYAASRGARIINASWGGAVCADTLKQMLESADLQNTLFVAASGNDGVDIDQFPEFPAAFGLANQLTVGASLQSGLMASFSNYGRLGVDILAPGHQILSTIPGGWQLASGTSMAAPFVSGLAALLWSAHPEATMAQIKRAIMASVLAPQAYFPVVAQGRINAPQALRALESQGQSPE
jgi:subtilisin family serine protease